MLYEGEGEEMNYLQTSTNSLTHSHPSVCFKLPANYELLRIPSVEVVAENGTCEFSQAISGLQDQERVYSQLIDKSNE